MPQLDAESASEKSVEDLLQAIKRHTRALDAQEEISEALGKLAVLAAKPDENKMIVNLSGITLVLQAMERHISAAGVQEKGCAALKNLSSNAGNEREIGEHDGIKAVIRSMDQHLEIAGVQQQACGALWNLGFLEDHKRKLVKLGGLDAVLRAMGQHADEKAVQEQAFGVLRKVLESKDCDLHVRVVELGGVGAVQRAILKNHMSPFTAEHGCWLWWHFLWMANHHEFCHKEILDHGNGDPAFKLLGKPFWKMAKVELDIRAGP